MEPDNGRSRRRRVPEYYRPVLLAAGLVLLALLFRQLATLVLAGLITVIVAIPLSAAATRLERLKVPRAVGALSALAAGLIAIGGVLLLVVPMFVEQLEQLVDQIPEIVSSLSGLFGEVTGEGPNRLGESIESWAQSLIDSPEQLVGPITSVGLSVAGIIAGLLLVLVTAVFIATRPDPLLEGSIRLAPPAHRETVRQVMTRLRASWIGWLRGVLVDMAVSGVLLYVGLTIIGLEFALAFAVISALLVVVPYFGAIAGGIPPVLFGLAESPTTGLLVLAVYLLVQQIEGNLIVPLVMAKAVRLHPAVVAIGVVVVGQLFGILGLFVAVPILSTFMVLADELWVKPLEGRSGDERPKAIELPREGVERATVPPR